MTASPKSSLPFVRLFQPGFDPDRPDGLSSRMTLLEFFNAYIAPAWLKERHASPLTVELYRDALDHWKSFTGDPPLDEIDDFCTAQFLAGLYELPGRKHEKVSPYTVKKHRRAVQTCLNLAGPRCSRFKKAQRLLLEVPFLEDVPVDRGEVDDNFTIAEMSQILEGTWKMRSPKLAGVPTPHWWQSLVVCTYNLGERRGGILGVAFSELRHSDKKGWTLKFPPSIRKGRIKANVVPVNGPALAAIERIRTPRQLIFEFPSGIGDARKYFPDNARHFHRLWQNLLAYAGIPEDRRFGLHGLRKATATEVASFSPLAAQLVMGHSDSKMTTEHYINPRTKAEALQKIPQPAMPVQQLDFNLKPAKKPRQPKKPAAPKFDPQQTDFLPPIDD